MGLHRFIYFFLLSVFLLSAHKANAAAKCRPQDKAALLAFRKTYVDDPSADPECNLYDWNESVDCCSWHNVVCDSSTGNVIRLSVVNICGKGTSATFSSTSSLFQLTSLQSLQLALIHSPLSPIPNEISKLTQLRTLTLRGANLIGPIPQSLGTLAKLTDLDLSSNSFSGAIPLSFVNLKNLQSLNLLSCGLTGTIPNGLANLPQLQRLQLRENSLTGVIPAAFFTHPRLSNLDLSSNQLRGSFPTTLVGSSNLSQLVLSNNTLDGIIPSWIFAIKSLQTLDLGRNSLGPLQPFPKPTASSLESVDLSFNKISGPFPSSLQQLVKVSSLSLEANQLTGVVEWNSFKNMVNLASLTISLNRGLDLKNTKGAPTILPLFRILDVRSCSLTEFPNFLSGFSEFQYLDVSDNRIGGAVFKQGGWPQLGVFNGSHNQFTAFEFPNERIYWFDLSYNLLTGPLPKPPSSLELLSLVHNKIGGAIPTQYCNLTKIQILDMGYNNLGGVLPRCLMNISGDMRVLSLQHNRIGGVIPDAFGLAPDLGGTPSNQLNFIMLDNNNFQGPLPKSLSVCTNLKVLSVGNNQITDTFPLWLGQINPLQVLILSSNRFRGSIGAPANKTQFQNMQILDVSSNNFTGSLPTAIFQNLKYMMNLPAADVDYVGSGAYVWNDNNYRFLISVDITVKGVKLKSSNVLNTLTILDFSNNQFSGQIPSIIGNLKALKVLTLSQNKISGVIPPTIGNMNDLQSLDLSRNSIGGSIPQSLKNLKNLQYLNLSYNNLQGPIPSGKFASGSYIGNPGLCGPPLSKSC